MHESEELLFSSFAISYRYGSHLQEVGISKLSSLAHSNSLSKECHSLKNRRDNYVGSEMYNFAIEYVEYTIRV